RGSCEGVHRNRTLPHVRRRAGDADGPRAGDVRRHRDQQHVRRHRHRPRRRAAGRAGGGGVGQHQSRKSLAVRADSRQRSEIRDAGRCESHRRDSQRRDDARVPRLRERGKSDRGGGRRRCRCQRNDEGFGRLAGDALRRERGFETTRGEIVKKTLIAVLALITTNAFAAEGMWMPQQIPQLADELKKMGLKIDPNRFADLTGDPMGAVISLGGCSASFVSPEGLIVTNHHCGFGALQFNSTPQRDLITNGFLAKTKEEELPAGPGSRVFVTTTIEDVTPRVTGSLAATLSDIDREKAIDRSIKELVAECEKPGGVRCRVASFYEGASYIRTTQMEIRDVRLVYAPALGI